MFQFPGLAAMHLCIQRMLIQESWAHHLFVGSPKLFADFHAFRRLSIPRHPPCALSNLTIGISHSNPISQTSVLTNTHCIEISSDLRFKLPTSASNPGVNQNQIQCDPLSPISYCARSKTVFDLLPISLSQHPEEHQPNKTSG